MKLYKFKKILFLALLFFFSFQIFGQSEVIDSLKNKINQAEAREKIQLMNQLSKVYWDYSADSSLKYARKAHSIAEQINDKKGLSDALNRIGNAYYFLGDYEKALSFYKKCLDLRKNLNDYKRLIQIYNNIGVYYSATGNMEEAKQNYQKALDISKENNDNVEAANYYISLAEIYRQTNNVDKAVQYYYNAEELLKESNDNSALGDLYNRKGLIYRSISSYDKALKAYLEALDYHKAANDSIGMANSYNNIGIVNQTLENYDKALEYYNKMIEIFKKIGSKRDMAIAYNNIGIVYDEKGESEKALDYYEKAYAINKEFEDKIGMSSAQNNIGLIYFDQGEYEKALDYLHQSLELSKENNDKKSIANTYNNIGEVLLNQKKYEEAHNMIDKAITLSREINYREYIDESYRLYSLLYEEQNNYKKALLYHKKHTSLNDSLFSSEKQSRIAEIQIKYETDKKEKEIELLKKAHELKLKRQRTIITFNIIVAIMLAILVGLVYNQFRLKKKNTKILEEKNDQLEAANKKLKESENNLRELNATKDKFFSIISHDLKNPFQALFGFAEVMYHNINEFETEEIQDYSKAIYESSQNLYNLLENLLQWSKSQLGSIKLSLETLNLHNAVHEIISLLSINAEEKKLNVSNEIPENLTAYTDENVFSTVIRNLLNNSIKFTNPGGSINIQASLNENEVIISVADTGQGITKEKRNKLFQIDTNHSTKGTANESGTGLGLILCKELIEKSNGKIWVEDNEGKGSIFKFTLPKKPANS